MPVRCASSDVPMYSGSAMFDPLDPDPGIFPDQIRSSSSQLRRSSQSRNIPNMGTDEMAAKLFGDRIRDERNRHKWSQAELAERLSKRVKGIYPTTIHKIESGDRAIRFDELAAVADVFGVSVDALLGRRARTASNDRSFAANALFRSALQAASAAFVAAENLQDRSADLFGES